MDQIDKDVIAAEKLHLSYGYYKALSYNPAGTTPTIPKPKKKAMPQPNPRKYTDQEAFALWQAYYSDSEIAKEFGATRSSVQQWRTKLELPATGKAKIDTKKYRLAALQDGTTIAILEDDQL